MQGSFRSYNQRFPDNSAKKVGESPRDMNRISRRRAPGKPTLAQKSVGFSDTIRKALPGHGRAASVVDSQADGGDDAKRIKLTKPSKISTAGDQSKIEGILAVKSPSAIP